MRNPIIIRILFLFVCYFTQAQVLQTRSEIIEELGDDYKTGKIDGTEYILYENELNAVIGGKYTLRRLIFFQTLKDGTQLCFAWRNIQLASEINYSINYFNKNLVKVGDLIWKDGKTKIMYKAEISEVNNDFCFISCWYDHENKY